MWHRLAFVAWCLAWLTIAVWTAWFTWQAAENPRKEELSTWCAARTRYVHQQFVSSSNQVEVLAGLVKVFNGLSTSRGSLTYWGLQGVVTSATWIAFSEQWIQRIQPWSITAWTVYISHDERCVRVRVRVLCACVVCVRVRVRACVRVPCARVVCVRARVRACVGVCRHAVQHPLISLPSVHIFTFCLPSSRIPHIMSHSHHVAFT
ncbi:unnamed protein product [Closterium sp. NIES-53]